MIELNKIYCENCFDTMSKIPDNFIDCCITSPPYYGLRDYGHPDQIGLEETPDLYVRKLIDVFSEVKRILKPEGTLWLNLGDSYNGSGKASGQKPEHKNCGRIKQKRGYDVPKPTNIKGLKPKDLIGIPWMVAFALRAEGWYLRQDIIWHKPNPMPESVTDRCTKSHEYIFLLSKSLRYYYDQSSIQEVATGYDGRKDLQMHESNKYSNGYFPSDIKTQSIATKGHLRWKEIRDGLFVRNRRSVWIVPTSSLKEAHFATFPEDLIVPCIKAGSIENGIVYDPFMGAGTTALVSYKLGRKYIGSEINAEFCKIAEKRIEPYLMQQKLF